MSDEQMDAFRKTFQQFLGKEGECIECGTTENVLHMTPAHCRTCWEKIHSKEYREQQERDYPPTRIRPAYGDYEGTGWIDRGEG
jgi:hypothetical protein